MVHHTGIEFELNMSFKLITDYLLTSALQHVSVNSISSGHSFEFDVDGNYADLHFFLEYDPTQRTGRVPTYSMAFFLGALMKQDDPKNTDVEITVGGDTIKIRERDLLGYTELVWEEIIQQWKLSGSVAILPDSVNAMSISRYGDSMYSGWRVEFQANALVANVDRCVLPGRFGSVTQEVLDSFEEGIGA